MCFAPQAFLATGRYLLPVLAAFTLAAAAPTAQPLGRPAGREISTDRPDSTETPFTLEPGRMQLEMSFASYERDREDGRRTTAREIAPFNLRFGLTRSIEAGIFFLPYQRVTEQADGERATTTDGVGDFTARVKWNARGNDDGGFGAGVFLDVTLPTAPRAFGPRKVEAAVTLPVAFELGAGWSGGAMTSLRVARTQSGARQPIWFNTLALGRDIVGDLGGFIELASTAGDGGHALTLNGGLTHQLNPDLLLDAGVNVGISRAAPDVLWFAGLSRRF